MKANGKRNSTQPHGQTRLPTPPTYIDAFAGCGGLSLGLARAGWRGLLAIEKDKFAFETLRANFLEGDRKLHYLWPAWLDQKPWSVEGIVDAHSADLAALRGKVTLLAGGPPCQGFSSAGRRRADDPRNAMFERYLQLVELLQPPFLLLENVTGFTLDFKVDSSLARRPRENFAAQLARRLTPNYTLQTTILKASDYGVPQSRPRFVLVGIRAGGSFPMSLVEGLSVARQRVLNRYSLSKTTTAQEAISDLELGRNDVIPSSDSPGYEAIGYRAPITQFQRVMRDGFEGVPSDTRLAKHRAIIQDRFLEIIALCRSQDRSTRQLTTAMRESLGIRKLATRVLDPNRPAPTVTSMPDDLLHYKEPRTLTVRENARLQTFPDWFVFKGKYTTGGHLRKQEVPRFTQVANAVPPLLAEMLGLMLQTFLANESSVTPTYNVTSSLMSPQPDLPPVEHHRSGPLAPVRLRPAPSP